MTRALLAGLFFGLLLLAGCSEDTDGPTAEGAARTWTTEDADLVALPVEPPPGRPLAIRVIDFDDPGAPQQVSFEYNGYTIETCAHPTNADRICAGGNDYGHDFRRIEQNGAVTYYSTASKAKLGDEARSVVDYFRAAPTTSEPDWLRERADP